jgi:hypothetical protein
VLASVRVWRTMCLPLAAVRVTGARESPRSRLKSATEL